MARRSRVIVARIAAGPPIRGGISLTAIMPQRRTTRLPFGCGRRPRYELVDRQLTRKYGLSFEEFRRNRVVEQKGYSFEVESDFWDWELTLDGIETVQELLVSLTGPNGGH
jgi:hypothetical protein